MAALGHAPFGLWWVAIVGLSGLILAVSLAPRPALAAWFGGVAYFGVTLHWIVEPFLVDAATHGWMAPLALILMAGGLAGFWALAGWLAARTTPGPMGFALWLGLAEMARGHVATGFPWALPGYIWADTPAMGSVAIWGSYGLTLATLVLSALVWAAWRWWLKLGAGLALALATLLPGAVLPGAPDGAGPRVALIQPNIPQAEKWDAGRAEANTRRLIEMTAKAAGEGADLAIWPESAIPWPLDIAGPIFQEVGRQTDMSLLTGINRRAGESWFNAAVLARGGEVAAVYDKVHLVPFGEYIPFRIGWMRDLAGFSGFGFAAGEDVRAIDTPLGRAVVLICYEAIFPGHIARAGERPDVLIQITNDAWFGTFAGPFQHFDQARFRAVEQGLPLIRVANTGISSVVAPDGRILDSIPLGQAGWVVSGTPRAAPPTVYSRLGDLPVAAFMLFGIVLAAILHRRRR